MNLKSDCEGWYQGSNKYQTNENEEHHQVISHFILQTLSYKLVLNKARKQICTGSTLTWVNHATVRGAGLASRASGLRWALPGWGDLPRQRTWFPKAVSTARLKCVKWMCYGRSSDHSTDTASFFVSRESFCNNRIHNICLLYFSIEIIWTSWCHCSSNSPSLADTDQV